MNSINLFIFLVTAIFSAQDYSFRESTENTFESQSAAISYLKQKAVVHWAEAYLEKDFHYFERFFTPEFCEGYVDEFRINPTSSANQIEITGSLDTKALKNWIQLTKVKLKLVSPASLTILVTSSHSELPFNSQSALEFPAIKNLVNSISQKANKLQLKPQMGSAPLEVPPTQKSEFESIHARFPTGLVLWVHFKNTSRKNSFEVVTIWYASEQGRLLKSQQEEFNRSIISLRSSTDKEWIKSWQDALVSELEELYGSEKNQAQNKNYWIRLEGFDNYKKVVDFFHFLTSKEYLSEVQWSLNQKDVVYFEISSLLALTEIQKRFQEDISLGPQTQIAQQDAKTLILRYSRE